VARLAFVAAGLAELIGRDLDVPVAPDEAVAQGAAIRAAGIIRRA
jgi:molecular chaperone DnaK (HSP70)